MLLIKFFFTSFNHWLGLKVALYNYQSQSLKVIVSSAIPGIAPDLNLFRNIINQINQSKSLEGFDFTKKSASARVSTAGRLVRANHLKWTKTHFNFKILVDLVGEGKRAIS